jgi:hypothetical protein
MDNIMSDKKLHALLKIFYADDVRHSAVIAVSADKRLIDDALDNKLADMTDDERKDCTHYIVRYNFVKLLE